MSEPSFAFTQGVYGRHGEAIMAAVHDVMPEDHDGPMCDDVCRSVGRLVAQILWDRSNHS